jgi:heme A synthase
MSRLARYAWFVLAFNVFVILAGALVRATGSGAGCGPSWPSCKGELLPELEGATAVEFAHRAVSGIALILVFVLASLVWRRVPKGCPARVGALLSVISIVGEALIGAAIVLAEWVAEDASMARTVAVPLHLVNTMLLLAALTLTAFWLSGGRGLEWRRDAKLRRWVIAGGVALILISASGAITALADTLFPDEPFRADFDGESSFLTRLRLIHPVLAVLSASVGWWASSRAGITRSAASKALPILVGAMLVTGASNVLLGVLVWMQIVHLLLADALWIAYVLASAEALQISSVNVVNQAARHPSDT